MQNSLVSRTLSLILFRNADSYDGKISQGSLSPASTEQEPVGGKKKKEKHQIHTKSAHSST